MKHLLYIFLTAALLSGVSGCSVFNNPATQTKVNASGSTDKNKENKSAKNKNTTGNAGKKTSSKKITAKPVADKTPQKTQTPATKRVVRETREPAPEKKSDVLPKRLSTDVMDLAGEWYINNVSGQEIKGDNRPYLFFEPEKGRFYGSNGCNVLNGNLIADSTKNIRFTDVAASLRSCDSSTTTEYLINNAIADVTNFAIATTGDESLLNLRSKHGRNLIVLRRHNLGFANGAWTITSINGTEVNNPDLKFIIDIPERKLHGFAGCNVINGHIFVNPDRNNSIEFHNLSATRATCPDIAVESDILISLEEVETCHLLPNGTLVLRDSDGNDKITLKPLDL